MRITFVVRSLAIGGAERQIVTTTKLLAEKGHDVQLIVLSKNMSMAEPLRGTTVKVVVIEKANRWQLRGWLAKLRTELRARIPSVVCPWQPAEGLLTLLASAGLPGLTLLWSVRCSGLDMRDYDLVTRGVFWMHRQLVARGVGSGAVFNSFAGARDYGVVPNGANYSVVWNAIDFSVFRPDATLGSQWRSTSGYLPEDKLVVSVGRLTAMKDHLLLIRAAVLVFAEEPRANFAIVGEGAGLLREELVAAIRDCGLEDVVHLLGRRSDIPAILNAASVVVSSSRYGEGIQNSLAEAMACGRPVVATDVGDASRFLLDEDFIVAPGDAVGMARAILRQLNRQDGEAGIARTAHAKLCFSGGRLFEQLERCLLAVAT